MNAIAQGLGKAGRRLLAAPGAVFLAVLTAGMTTASLARHAGLYHNNANAEQKKNVVLACPRSSAAARATAAGAGPSAPKPRQKTVTAAPNSPAGSPAPTVANNSVPSEKHQTGKTGGSGGGLSVPLPDFSAPELSRFISPL